MTNEERTLEFDDRATPAIGDVISGKYRIDSVLGTGGMGKVFGATHLGLGQKVAIKVLTVEPSDTRLEEAQERFLREGRATAALVSDHVVRIYDVGTLESGALFMVMEQLRGDDLGHLLQKNGPFALDLAADCVRQAAAGIAAAHGQGIVHRDLKPSNLFLTHRSDGSPLIKVLDFGISKNMQAELESLAGSLTVTRSVLGTPFYMSPEQVRDAKKVDFRTDVWSLGLILHELLSGSPAFEGTTLPGVCASIVADPPAALRLKRPEVPVELENIVLKCLEKDPARRIQTAAALVLELAPWTGRAPSGVLPPFSDRTIRSSATTMNHLELLPPSERAGESPRDTGTMASAVLSKSGERVSSKAEAQKARAQAEPAASPGATAPAPVVSTTLASSGRPFRRRSVVLLAMSMLVLAALGALLARARRVTPNQSTSRPEAAASPTAARTAPSPTQRQDAPAPASSAAPAAPPDPATQPAPKTQQRAPLAKPKAYPKPSASSVTPTAPSDIFMQR